MKVGGMYNWRGSAYACYVPYIRCPQALAMSHAIQQYQKKGDAMQCNKMVKVNARKIVTSCSVPGYDVLGRSPCHPAQSFQHSRLLLYSFLCKTAAVKRRQRRTLRKNALSYTHAFTVFRNATIQCNAMQRNAMAQPNARENAMSCSVPCIRCPRALAMPSSPIF